MILQILHNCQKGGKQKMLPVHWICPAHLWLNDLERSAVPSLADITGLTPVTVLVQPSESLIPFWLAPKSVWSH